MTGFNAKAYKSAGMAGLTALILMLAPARLPAGPSNIGLKVMHTGFVMNHATNRWVSNLKVTNQSSAAISGPIRVSLTNLSANASLVNPTGLQNGVPYIDITVNTLAPGETLTVPLKFVNVTNGFITFVPVVVGGN